MLPNQEPLRRRTIQKFAVVSQRGVNRAKLLAAIYQIPSVAHSFPPPAVGGPIIEAHLFEIILEDNTYGGVKRGTIHDVLDRCIGAAEDEVAASKRRLWNPLHWLKLAFSTVLRVPFTLLEATGFDVGKIEDHVFGKLFKLLELVVIVLLLFHWLNFSKEDLVEIVKALVGG